MANANRINDMAVGDLRPEKAGVGGSIPSLATIFSTIYDTRRPRVPSNSCQSARRPVLAGRFFFIALAFAELTIGLCKKPPARSAGGFLIEAQVRPIHPKPGLVERLEHCHLGAVPLSGIQSVLLALLRLALGQHLVLGAVGLPDFTQEVAAAVAVEDELAAR